jgi:fructosamine-3-kinase
MNLKIPGLHKFLRDNCLELKDSSPVSGGSIADCQKLNLSGQNYFFKSYGRQSKLHQIEVDSLAFLSQGDFFSVPKVFAVDEDFILMEYVEPGKKNDNFYQSFGTALAKYHKQESENIGLDFNNYIGRTEQKNVLKAIDRKVIKNQWIDFYWNYRICAQLEISEYPVDIKDGFSELYKVLPELFHDWQEHISPLHGDLWGSNHLASVDGRPYLIDPAFYFGCREADLALINLFAAYPDSFWFAYKEEFPLKSGYQRRKKIYQLYHLMNHFHLFGGGYLDQIRTSLFSLISRPGYL